MFFEVKMPQTMYAWCFERLKCAKQHLGDVFRGFEERRKVWFTFLKAKRQQKKHHSGCDQLYTKVKAVSDVFKGWTAIRRSALTE